MGNGDATQSYRSAPPWRSRVGCSTPRAHGRALSMALTPELHLNLSQDLHKLLKCRPANADPGESCDELHTLLSRLGLAGQEQSGTVVCSDTVCTRVTHLMIVRESKTYEL